MNTNYTDITMLIDRSGSMASMKKEVPAGINALLAEQSKLDGKILYTEYQFDTNPYVKIEKHVDAVDVKKVLRYGNLVGSQRQFSPRGGTPLYDAVVKSIKETGQRLAAMPEEERPGRVLFLIFTDGEENASVEANARAAKAEIDHQTTKYGWVFTWLGKEMASIENFKAMGVSKQNYIQTHNSVGTVSNIQTFSAKAAHAHQMNTTNSADLMKAFEITQAERDATDKLKGTN